MRQFEVELDRLRQFLLEMAGVVESSIHRSVAALVRRDQDEALRVFETENRINEMEVEIDGRATRLLALDQPVAKDLRLIAAVLKINNDLERMGDEAVNIAARAVALINENPVNPPVDIPRMAGLVVSMVRKALDCFVKEDADTAREILVFDDVVDELWDSTISELVSFIQSDTSTAPQCTNLIFVAQSLERIADHATNIAEDVIYLVEGIDVRHHAEAIKLN